MNYEEHKEKVDEFFSGIESPVIDEYTVSEALHAMNELNLWPNDVTVDEDQLFKCWCVVEKLKQVDFPDELRM